MGLHIARDQRRMMMAEGALEKGNGFAYTEASSERLSRQREQSPGLMARRHRCVREKLGRAQGM